MDDLPFINGIEEVSFYFQHCCQIMQLIPICTAVFLASAFNKFCLFPTHDCLTVIQFQEVSPHSESDILYAILQVCKAPFFIPSMAGAKLKYSCWSLA